MKNNKAAHWLSFITSRGTYQEAMFEEDADRLMAHYRDKGYITARIGQPEVKILQDEKDGKTRNIELKIPISEGDRYRIGSLDFDGNKVVKTEGLRPLFKLKEGDYYSEKKIRKGMEISRELYGTVGYWEFTGYPDLKPRNIPDASKGNDPAAVAEAKKQPAIVDVTMKMQEGEQYFVNRITFQGNTTTRDNVIRREVRLLENGVFNTEALKFSVKRINQLGYFKQIEEGSDVVKVEKTPGEKNKVDVTLKFEEQNRNQLTFGAGVSQYEGFFGQLAFQTSNFLGRGESVTFSVMAGARVQNYQLAFSEPFLFDRPITAGMDLYKREIRYYYSVHAGLDRRQHRHRVPGRQLLADVPRLPAGAVAREGHRRELPRPGGHRPQPVPGRRAAHQRRRQASHQPGDAELRAQHDRQSDLPERRQAVHARVGLRGPRRQRQLHQAEGGSDLLASDHAQVDAGHAGPGTNTSGRTAARWHCPIYERLFLGGEYSIRGYDIRSIGPRDIGTPELPGTFIVLGGNKSALFNTELQFSIASMVRVMAFYDAGQVQDQGIRMNWDDFVMSTGAEVRFFMPVLNVPFRLIYARNINYEGIYDNDLQPVKQNVFRFAVGSTF